MSRLGSMTRPATHLAIALTGAALLTAAPALLAMHRPADSTPATDPPPSASLVATPAALPLPAIRDAQLPPLSSSATRRITLEVVEQAVLIAPGVTYAAWTFNGRVPGPVLRVREGDTIQITLVNRGRYPHSIDFHAARTAPNLGFRSVPPGGTLTFSWKARDPGAFLYHCGTAPVLYHIASGMYGAIIVEPRERLESAREYVLVQSEFFTMAGPEGAREGDVKKMLAGEPDYVVWNGVANQYQQRPLEAAPNQRLRLWLVNAGPNRFAAFHVVGALLDRVYPDGNPANELRGLQTYTVPPGGGAMAELRIERQGLYPFVTHAFADATKGAIGVLQIGAGGSSEAR